MNSYLTPVQISKKVCIQDSRELPIIKKRTFPYQEYNQDHKREKIESESEPEPSLNENPDAALEILSLKDIIIKQNKIIYDHNTRLREISIAYQELSNKFKQLEDSVSISNAFSSRMLPCSMELT